MDTGARGKLSPGDLERFHVFALRLADAARSQIRAIRTAGFDVQRKDDGSYVTSADLQIEEQLRTMVQKQYPGHGIVGEEFPAHEPQSEFQWIFDPVDGTEDFVQGIPTFGTIIGLHFRGDPVVGVVDVPLLDDRVHAAFGRGSFRGKERLRLTDLAPDTPAAQIRLMLAARANFLRHTNGNAAFDTLTRHYPNHRIYRTCYTHLLATTGQIDAMVEYGNKLWDLAAARILIEEAGGAYRPIESLETDDGLVLAAAFGKPALVAQLVDLLSDPS